MMNSSTGTAGVTTNPSTSAKPAGAHEARQSIWAFAGGKGGVGRSLLAANLGIQLARAGRRVVLVDLDLQGCNLPTFLGYQRLPRTLSDLASGKAALLSELACETPTAQLRIIGGLQRGELRDDPVAFVRQVAGQFSTLAADHILIDCGSGRWPASVAAFAEATIGILVTTPEPAALESAYLFTEAYLRWCVVRAVTGEKMSAIEARLRESGADPAGLSFRSFMTRLEGIDAAARDAIAAVIRRTRLELLLNQVRTEADEEASACLASGFRKCFGVNLATAGIIEHDLSVLQAVQKRRPLSQQYPNAASTKEISRAAARLLSVGVGPLRDPDEEWEDLDGLDHYRVLEVVPKASPKEVQSAYQLLKKTYDPDTTCLSPLMDAPGLRDLQGRIEAAYRTLIFLESRSDYDRRLLGSGALREDQVRGLHAAPGAPGLAPAALELAGGQSVAPPAEDASPTAPVATPGSPATGGGAEPAPESDVPGVPASVAPSPVPTAPEGPGLPGHQEGEAQPTPGSGAELREARQRLNLAVETIAEKTKIRRAYLQAIEEERFGDLPAAVFVRGFLREYARCLGLPGDEVTGLYMKRHRDWQESRGQSSEPAPPWSHN
ncbi:MAG TPA: helix-turn-helix domain-containing protein [Candidatus Polarisedimenticolia bacterium]|jgi:flagellar biosynthesis protein FlhG|nr:helix-turn-helix domain-containing protein [Candidatus Polarisedimenticolia bacterium]